MPATGRGLPGDLDGVTGPGDLAATLFWRFGVDPAREMFDSTGRPYKLAEGTAVRELFAGWRESAGCRVVVLVELASRQQAWHSSLSRPSDAAPLRCLS